MQRPASERSAEGPRGGVSLRPEDLERVFPFYFEIVEEMGQLRFGAIGPSLPKILPHAEAGTALADGLDLTSPRADWDLAAWRRLAQRPFVLRVKHSPISLRGQMLEANEGATLLFLGSPWAPDPESLQSIGLQMADFAIHDATLDHLLIVQANRRAVEDARSTLEALSDETAARARLEETERALEHDLNASGDLRIRLDADGRLIEIRAVRKIECLDRAIGCLDAPIERVLPELARVIRPMIEADRREPWAFDFGFGDNGEGPFYTCRLVRTLSGESLLVGSDVTDRRQLEERLKRQALHDPLTGLANRTVLFDQIDRICSRRDGKSLPHGVALLLLDLDGFKTVNDTLGHSTGDALLVEVARRMSDALRPSDLCARIGGDEFGVLLRDLGHPGQAWEVAHRLLDHLRRPFVAEGAEVRPAGSIGIALADEAAAADSLYPNADLALYRAKSLGKGTIELFDSDLQAASIRRARLKRDLPRAVEAGEFVLHHQPVIDLETKRMIGVEALVRWEHPDLGLLAPDQFIPLAEESGAILALGRAIFDDALETRARWRSEGVDPEFEMAINLSRKQLQDDAFVPHVRAALTRTDLPGECLTFEVTEGLVMEDSERASRTLERLRELGARVAMDDFGRDYSSLSELDRLPIDILKVDKLFVDRLREGEACPIPEAIVTLGRALGMTVIAEGVEEPSQRNRLRELGCPRAQGYLFSRPVPAETISKWIQASDDAFGSGEA